MPNLLQLIKEGKIKDAWLKYCGFIDLSINDFMGVQERLLMEQINLLSNSQLGKHLMGGLIPKDLAEFRKIVPLTGYEDYIPFLSEKNEEVLPLKPDYWICTSGKLGNYERKWAPYTRGMVQTHIKNFLAAVIFSVSSKKYDFNLRENYKFLYAMAPPPYLTGMVPYGLKDEFSFDYLPPLKNAEEMTFEERNREGFRQGLNKGINLFFGVSSVLVKIGEKFSGNGSGGSEFGKRSAASLIRLAAGYAKARIYRRKLLPKDVWNLQGIICAGTDTAFYKDRIKYYWGVKPIEIYGGTEIGIAATQAWDHEGMILFPDANLWEFIPEEEYSKSMADPHYRPETVLTNELEPGKRYELVVTNYRGGAFVRYRVGDLIKVLKLKNEKLGIELPQVVFEDRVQDVIDLAGFTRFTERTVWEALKIAGISHGNWVARKSFSEAHPIMELYIECEEENVDEMYKTLHNAFCLVDSDYHDIEEILGFKPLKLVTVPKGIIKSIQDKQRAQEGMELEKFTRINPSDRIMEEIGENIS